MEGKSDKKTSTCRRFWRSAGAGEYREAFGAENHGTRADAVSDVISKVAGTASCTADPCTTIVRPYGSSIDTSRRRLAHRLPDLPLRVPSRSQCLRPSRPIGPTSIPLPAPDCIFPGRRRECRKSSLIGLFRPLLKLTPWLSLAPFEQLRVIPVFEERGFGSFCFLPRFNCLANRPLI